MPNAKARTTASAIWFETTMPRVQLESWPTRRTAASRRSNRHCSLRPPADTSDGTSSIAWIATPTVVPSPSSASLDGEVATDESVGEGSMAANQISTAMHTTLLAIGVHAGAPNR